MKGETGPSAQAPALGEGCLTLETHQSRGVKLIVTGGHISPMVAFKGPNVISGL